MQPGAFIALALIVPPVVGLILTFLLRKITGKSGKSYGGWSRFGDFVSLWVVTTIILYGVVLVIWMGECKNS